MIPSQGTEGKIASSKYAKIGRNTKVNFHSNENFHLLYSPISEGETTASNVSNKTTELLQSYVSSKKQDKV